MTTLIIPAAGLSARYGLSRPKFLLQHPTDGLMLTAGLRGLSGLAIERTIVVSLEQHFDGIDTARVEAEIHDVIGSGEVSINLLEAPTSSMVETIVAGVASLSDDGPFIVKDTDNLVSVQGLNPTGNFVCYADLADFPQVQVANKSFVELDSNEFLEGIVEKRMVSGSINTGLVGFASASEFLLASRQISSAREIYLSDVVRAMIANGAMFRGYAASDYLDWGTLDDWLQFTRSFGTIFLDVDGVVAANENPYASGDGGWSRFRGLYENIEYIRELSASGRYALIFTTSRTEEYRDVLESALRQHGIEWNQIVMGLPHARRYLVNDHAPTNPYPSAVAVSQPRNDSTLRSTLGELLR